MRRRTQPVLEDIVNMYILGFSGGFDPVYGTEDPSQDHRFNLHEHELHDSSAVLLKDGEIIAAIEEERLTRIKHTNARASHAIRACLEMGGISAAQVDHFAYPCTERNATRLLAMHSLRRPSITPHWDARTFLSELLSEICETPVSGERLKFAEHHICHALSAYSVSGFDDALVVTIDGQGEGIAGTVFETRDGKLKRLSNTPKGQSLGLFYETVIAFLGYQQHDEYKVMGLAPYGDPSRYRHLFEEIYSLRNKRSFLNMLRGARNTPSYRLAMSKVPLLREVGPPRRKGEPFEQRHKDLAAALQESLESLILHHMAHYQSLTKQRKLCLAGGVAHNCSANGRLLKSGMFDEIFVQPAAHDAGLSLGAALAIHREVAPAMPVAPMRHVYYGTDIPAADALEKMLGDWRRFVTVEKLENAPATAASLLADGKVIGWVQGRAEFGPRALGNRSILADPRPEENKTRINAMVKKREGYRPFAPSVMEEHASEYFDIPPDTRFPFMIMITDVAEDKRDVLGATTHVDGSARIHTVNREVNPRYHALIDAFRERTGVPVVLNTSFNNNVEPIVDSAEDALVAYLTTGLDHLIIGDYLVTKREVAREEILDLAAEVPQELQLLAKDTFAPERGRVLVHSLHRANTADVDTPVSPDMYHALAERAPSKRLREGLNGTRDVDGFVEEAWDLWEKRLLRLAPPATSN